MPAGPARTTILPLTAALLLTLAAIPQPTHAAGLDIFAWQLGTAVDASGGSDRDISFTPVNPFTPTQSANVGDSTAATTYDIRWTAQQLTFMLNATHQLLIPQPDSTFSRSAGFIRYQSDQPTRIIFDLEYEYDIPGTALQASALLGIEANEIVLFSDHKTGGPLILEPPAGSFQIHDVVDVPSNTETFLSYSMSIITASGANTLAEATGHLNFTIETIPEPQTALLLTIPTLAIARRRHRPYPCTP